ncbi:ATP-binding protein [uncultured Neptuniibacter sp.]|uniref:ATP-binding protein n=1 Tax=uncultured Neptuniibacter sp. TaxID=502143 RepID=UPI002639B47F|nr:ATP-binding protein [uncultured Neptuniibacter sp.]
MPLPKASSWRRYRLIFFIVLALAFLLVVGQTTLISRSQGYDQLQQRSGADLNRYLLSLQQKLDRYKDLPALLSSHSILINALQKPEDEFLKGQASVYLEHVNNSINAADVYIMNREGTAIAASNWAEARSFVGKNYGFRPYFKDAIQGKSGRYFALGTVSKRRGYYFSYPVYERSQIIGVVVVKIDLNEIESDWTDPDLDILVTDEDGVIFISTREDWKFRTLQPLSQGDIQRIAESLRYGDHQLTALDIISQRPREKGGTLITLVDGTRINNKALDGIKTREFLQQSRELEDSGLTVVVLASTQPVKLRMFYSALTTGFIFVAMVLLVLFLSTRQRITRERARFKLLETQALEENEKRVRAIIDNTQAGLITLDAQGRIESMNIMAEKLFGYSEESIRFQYFSKLLSQADRALCWQHLTASDQDRLDELFTEASGLRCDGSAFPIELIIGHMDYGSIKRFIVTIHDITQRKLYEEELQHARDLLEHRVVERTADLTDANLRLTEEVENHKHTQNELIQTAKLAVLGQMSAGINHELNQPLTAIRTYADNARAFIDRGKVETAEKNLNEISLLTERMAKIIHPLKEFSRKTSGRPEPVCLKTVHDGAMSVMYGRLSKTDAEINWPQGLDQVYVMGDTVRLEQVLVNLISNALQAMENEPRQQVDICVVAQSDWIGLQVRDYGPGVPEQDLNRVFEPFYTTKKAGQGLGLGLSISHRIIESMGGRLSVSNHAEVGAVFEISLPSAQAPDNVSGKTIG